MSASTALYGVPWPIMGAWRGTLRKECVATGRNRAKTLQLLIVAKLPGVMRTRRPDRTIQECAYANALGWVGPNHARNAVRMQLMQ
jgi:hypothetical protein